MSTRARLLAGAAALAAAAGTAAAQAPPPQLAPVEPLTPRMLPPVVPVIPAIPVSRQPAAPKAEPKPAPKPEIKPVTPPADMKPAVPAAPATAAPPVTMQGCGPDGGCAPAKKPEYDPWAKLRGPSADFWASYNQGLLWFQPSPVGIPIAVGGTAGRPVQVLLGGADRELGQYNTFGFDTGMWLDNCHVRGVGVGGFITENRQVVDTVSGGPANGLSINRPFTSLITNAAGVTTPQPDALAVAGPGFAGSIALQQQARFASGYVNFQKLVAHSDRYTAVTFFGFRYYDLDEAVTVYQRSVLPTAGTVGGIQVPGGTVVRLTDRFKARNQFYGGEAGGRFVVHSGRGSLALIPRIAFGPNHQTLDVTGETRAGSTVRVPGGLLAAGRGLTDGNLGRYSDTRFALAGDMAAEAGLQVTCSLRLKASYHFYFLNNVVRPGSQFDAVINTRVVPVSQAFGSASGQPAPRITFDREGFYAHGVMLAAEFTY